MGSSGKLKKISRGGKYSRSRRDVKSGASERRVVGRARDAVSALLRQKRSPAAGGDPLAPAVGTVLLAASIVLLERFVEDGTSPLRRLMKNDRRRAGGERLWEALRESSGKHSILSKGLLGRGLERILREPPSEGAVAPFLAFLDAVVAEEGAGDEWASLRLPGAVYEASLGWEATGAGVGRNSKRVKTLGAVYTPVPVVQLIVERTLRPLLADAETPEDLQAVSVCDPACGAGTFLLEAMRVLEDEAVRRGWVGPKRQERLAWRRQMGLQALYGVDIDPEAVHLARLGLWLASGGGEGAAEALSRSVQRGDALVGAWRDDLGLAGSGEPDPEAIRRAMDAWCERLFPTGEAPSAFHWELAFPERFAPDGDGRRGWAAVVGNPPYVGPRAIRHLAPYLRARFTETYTGYNDLSAFFVHRGLELLQPGGRLGFIAPAYWFQNTYGEKLRRYVLATSRLEAVFDFGPSQVFPGRGVHTAAVILAKRRAGEGADGHQVHYRPISLTELNGPAGGPTGPEARVPQRALDPSRWVFASAEVDAILKKAHRVGCPLGALFHIEKGPTSGCNSVFTLNKEDIEKHGIEDELLRPCLKNGEIRRYRPLRPRRWLLYLDDEVDVSRYPRAAAYLEANRARLASRNEARLGRHPWWRLERPRRRSLFEAPAKLVVPYRAAENRFTLDERGCFNDGGDIRVLVPKAGVGRSTMLAALAIANSALGNLVYRYVGKPKGAMLEYFVRPLATAPFGPPHASWGPEDASNAEAWLAEEGPAGLVRRLFRQTNGKALITPALAWMAERMLALHQDGAEANVILETDEAIDRLVGRLFGLTPAEEAVVVQEAAGLDKAGRLRG